MDSENLVHVTATGEKLSLGNEIIKLEDRTDYTFIAANPQALHDYLEKEDMGFSLYVGEANIEAYNNAVIYGEYGIKPDARCAIEVHPIAAFLKGINGKQMDINLFTQVLKKLKKYLGTDSIKLADDINALKVSKIITIDHQKDKKGNYLYSVKSEKNGNHDYEFPEELKLNIPLIKGLSDTSTVVTMDFYFGFTNDGESVSMNFVLENVELQDVIDAGIKDVIEATFSNKPEQNKYSLNYGTMQIVYQTNAWELYKNELVIKKY